MRGRWVRHPPYSAVSTSRRGYDVQMSRFKRIKDWPESLKTMSIAELRHAHEYWIMRASHLGHPQARKGAINYSRDAEKELARRTAER